MPRPIRRELSPEQWATVVRCLPVVDAAAHHFAKGRDPAEWYDPAIDGAISAVATYPGPLESNGFARWLKVAIRTRTIDRMRRRKLRGLDRSISYHLRPDPSGTEPMEPARPIPFVEDDAFDRLMAFLDHPIQIRVIRLRYLDGFGPTEIARMLGMTLGQINHHERRALTALYKALGGSGDRYAPERPGRHRKPVASLS